MKVRAVTDLVVFHYHFLPGGVSSVVRSALRALRDHGAGIRKVTLAGAAFPEGGWQGDEPAVRVYPELGYRDGRDPPPAAVAAEGRRLGEELLRRFGSDNAIWWVHNHHLGRNPAFTQALLEVARSGKQRLILQIHDFPECGRYDNLGRLRRSLTAPPYPIGPSVRYALINRRDLAALREAGIPGEHLHLLENPLEPDDGRAAAPAAEVRRALGLAGRPLLLYPVRCIRRKNVLEAALLCRLLPEPAGLAVTLPGISAEERGYSRCVQRAFARGWAPGVFGAGRLLQARGLHLEDLFRASDLVLSASVQEGFGYLFLQSLAWGRPLLARDLDVLEGMRDLFAGRPVELYREVRAPLPARARRRLLEAYRRKLDRLAGSGLLPEETTRDLEGRLESACGQSEVEFSFLPAAGQLELLRAAGREARLAARLRELNCGPLQSLERLLAEGARGGAPEPPGPELAGRLQQRFGLERFAAAFDGICRSFAGQAAGSSAPEEAAVWERIIRRFATVENVRLLHGD